MSAQPMDLLARMDPDSAHARWRPFDWECELREARAAVAELIGADNEFDSAKAFLLSCGQQDRTTLLAGLDRVVAATQRRAAALARLSGAPQ